MRLQNKCNRQFTLYYEFCDAKNEDLGIFLGILFTFQLTG